MRTLRPYQDACLDGNDEWPGVYKSFAAHDSALVVMATGLGKTVLFSTLAHDWENGRVLILAHRRELIEQAANEVHEITGERPDVEMAEHRASPTLFGGSKVVVSSVQSLCQDRRILSDVYRPENFGLIVWDEAHHCSKANKSYKRIYDHFGRSKHLLVTATPDRGDKKSLSPFAQTVAFNYPIGPAVNDGWLVPIRQQFVVCNNLDFARVRSVAGDFQSRSLADVMEQERVLHEVVGPLLEISDKRKTLVFASSIGHAERMAEIINRYDGRRACAVHGGNKEHPMSPDARRRHLQAYRDGEFQYLIGCDVFYEGYNERSIACVAVARPTKSRSRYAQAVGRGTRIVVPEVELDYQVASNRIEAIARSHKPDLLVLDFVGASSSLKLDLASTADLLAGEDASPEAVRRAKAKAKKRGGVNDMRELVEESAKEIADEEARKARRPVVAKAQYVSVNVDPFEHTGGVQAGGAGTRAASVATPNQIAFLARRGVDAVGMSKKQAGVLIDKYKDRPTLGQQRALAKNGERTDCTATKASALLDLLDTRGWRPRSYPLTRDVWRLHHDKDGSWSAVVMDPDVGRVILKPRFSSQESCREFIMKCIEDKPAAVMPAELFGSTA